MYTLRQKREFVTCFYLVLDVSPFNKKFARLVVTIHSFRLPCINAIYLTSLFDIPDPIISEFTPNIVAAAQED